MKKQTIIVAALVFTILGLSGTAFAWNHGQGHGKRLCQGVDNTTGPWANLSEDQKTQLQTLHQKFIDDTAETRTGMRSKQEEMKILMQTSSPDKERLLQISNELGDLKKLMMEKRINFALEAKTIAPDVNFPAGCGSFGGRGGMGGMGMGMGCPGQSNNNQKPDCINQ